MVLGWQASSAANAPAVRAWWSSSFADTVIAMNVAATRVVLILGLAACSSLPSVALAESRTVTDELGDIFPSSEISDITSATVTYDKARITIEVEHSAWDAQWKRYRSATGGKLTFSNGRSYVVSSGMGGRKSVLTTLKQFRDCSAGVVRASHFHALAGPTRSTRRICERRSVSRFGASRRRRPRSRSFRST